MTATIVTVTATFTDGSDTPVSGGRVSFQLSQLAQIPGSDLTVGTGPIRCTTNTQGQLIGPQGQVGCPLVANDNTGINPAGTNYLVSVTLPGGVVTLYTITIESSMAPTIDFSDLTLNPYTP